MASYLVLIPPGARPDDENTHFIADGFVWTAFIFPGLWLLVKRQWIAGFVVIALQIAIAVLTAEPEAFLAAVLIELAIRALVGLEGSAFIARRLEAAGWTLRAVIVADDLETTEEIYDLEAADDAADHWQPPTLPSSPAGRRPSFGLFENYGER